MTAPAQTERVFEGRTMEDGHTGFFLDGVRLPSVGRILNAGKDTSRIPAWTSVFGKLVHAAIELDNLGTLDESTLVAQEIDGRWLDPWPRLNAWRTYARTEREGQRPYVVEKPVWGEIDGLAFCGVIDAVWWLWEGWSVDDAKTGKPRADDHGPQVAAYAHAWAQTIARQFPETADTRTLPGCVYLREDGTHERVAYDHQRFFNAFRVALVRWYRDNKEG